MYKVTWGLQLGVKEPPHDILRKRYLLIHLLIKRWARNQISWTDR